MRDAVLSAKVLLSFSFGELAVHGKATTQGEKKPTKPSFVRAIRQQARVRGFDMQLKFAENGWTGYDNCYSNSFSLVLSRKFR